MSRTPVLSLDTYREVPVGGVARRVCPRSLTDVSSVSQHLQRGHRTVSWNTHWGAEEKQRRWEANRQPAQSLVSDRRKGPFTALWYV